MMIASPSAAVESTYSQAGASWPRTPADVTADRLERFYLVRAQLSFGVSDALPATSQRWVDSLLKAADCFGLALLLHQIRESYPVVADHLARQLWLALDEEMTVPVRTADWLQELGVSPQEVRRLGERIARDQMPKAESAVLRSAVEAIEELRLTMTDHGRPAPDVIDAHWLLEVMASKAEADADGRAGTDRPEPVVDGVQS